LKKQIIDSFGDLVNSDWLFDL